MKKNLVLLFVTLFLCDTFLSIVFASKGSRDHLCFIPNKGQWEDFVRFKSEFRGGALFFEDRAITYVMQDRGAIDEILSRKFSSPDSNDHNRVYEMYAYRMYFEGSSLIPEIEGTGKFSDYNNYYIGKDSKHWAVGVPIYKSIRYNHLYDGIDLRYYEFENSYKYEYIIEENANPQQIKIRYDGVRRLFIRGGNLIIKVGNIEAFELKPYAYQIDENGKEQSVKCNFSVRGKIVTFKLGEYDKSKQLIIDPVMVFCSYTGSFADNWGYTATYDSHGNLYGGGSVFGNGYPYTLGAYQTTFGKGVCDISIIKFSENGDSILFSTYLGGSRSEVPHSLVVNDNDELYVLATTSSWNYPVLPNGYDTNFHWSNDTFVLTNLITYVGGINIAISKFNASGTQLLGSTYFGGNGIDGLSTVLDLRKNYADEVRGEIMVDAYSNVYVVSSTSSTNLPTTSKSFQQNYGGGKQDGCVMKFSYDLSHLIWCSYIGGDSSDAAYSMVLDKENNLYVCGGTRSRNLKSTPFAVQKNNAGGAGDGFIANISVNGDRLKALTYYGYGGYDQVYLVKIDQENSVYVMGLTDATGNEYIKNAQWYVTGGGQFITKFNSSLSSIIWSTAFGTGLRSGPDISPTALMVDLCHQVYISGWGSPVVNNNVGYKNCGTRGLPVSANAFKYITDNNDFYFLSIDANASNMLYGTFFGGNFGAEHVDGGTSRFDRKGYIYQAVCASCGGYNDLPVTPGVAGPNNNSCNCNLGVVKIDFKIKEVVADFSMPNVICAPFGISFENTSKIISNLTTSFLWDFGDGTTSRQKSPSHLYTESGTYKVKLIVTDTSACNYTDTLSKDLIVLSNSRDTLPDLYICKGNFVQIGIQPANSSNVFYSWYPSEGLSATDIANPIASDTVDRIYSLTISDGNCVDTFVVRVNVIDAYLEAGPDKVVCKGDTLNLKISERECEYFQWSSSSAFSDTLNASLSGSDLSLENWNAQTYYVKAQNDYCILIDSIKIISSEVVACLPSDTAACYNDTISLGVEAKGSQNVEFFTYEWMPKPIDQSNVGKVEYIADFDKEISVIVKNAYGCVGKDTMHLKVDTLNFLPVVEDIRCYGQKDGRIELLTLSGSGPFVYNWSPNVSNTNIAESLGGGNYTVVVTDTFSCTYQLDTQINEPSKLQIGIKDSNLTVFCDGNCNGMIELSVTGGVSPYRYHWITGDESLKISGLCAGEYVFIIEDFNRCSDTFHVRIWDTSSFSVKAQIKDASCFGSCDGSILLIANGEYPYQYNWANGSSVNSINDLCAGVYDVTIKDSRLCSRRIFPEVKEPEAIRIDSLFLKYPTCFGQSDGIIEFFVSGALPPYRYYWDGNPGGNRKTNLASGTYKIRITDKNNCSIDTLINLPQHDSIVGNIFCSKVPCKEVCNAFAKISLTGGNPPYTCLWDNGDTSFYASKLCYGEHSVEVIDSAGCVKTFNFFIKDSSTFTSEVKAWADRYTIYPGESVSLYVSDLGSDYSYIWSPSSDLESNEGTNVKAHPEDTIVFTVTVTDSFGCVESDTVGINVVEVICDDPFVYVPNSFTPNGDGLNDVLYVRGDIVEEIHFAIYDRWGEKVFESYKQSVGWDGTYKGKQCVQGVYVYYLEVACKGNAKNLLKGNITLIR